MKIYTIKDYYNDGLDDIMCLSLSEAQENLMAYVRAHDLFKRFDLAWAVDDDGEIVGVHDEGSVYLDIEIREQDLPIPEVSPESVSAFDMAMENAIDRFGKAETYNEMCEIDQCHWTIAFTDEHGKTNGFQVPWLSCAFDYFEGLVRYIRDDKDGLDYFRA